MRVPNLPVEGLDGRARSFGILGSYPPTACGLATFTAALASGLSAHDAQVGVVRVVDVGGQTAESDRVIGELVNGSATLPGRELGPAQQVRCGGGAPRIRTLRRHRR